MSEEFYGVLGVEKTASKDEIKDAFRRLALLYHPDWNRGFGAGERFAEISEAYAVLSDDEERTMYDALGPERYNDLLQVFRYHLERDIAKHEGWGSIRQDRYAATRQCCHDDTIESIIITLGLLILMYLFLTSF